MKLIRYRLKEQVSFGAVVGTAIHCLEAGPWEPVRLGAAIAALEEVELLAPCQPTKIIAVGRNYAAHAAEHGAEVPSEPLLFLKPSSAVVGPGASIVYPHHLSQWVEHEAELAVVIGRRAYQVSRGAASSVVLGYTCANDVTARDLQERDGQWTRSKSFDTFCPIGPWIVTGVEVDDLAIQCRVNGELRQDSRTGAMIFSVDELIAYASAVMSLYPGDIILTGTPDGVGPLVPGELVTVEIGGIGALENRVVSRR
jgi:2-keto-4-pentenoate hydratase/2-oxohepta-3-ene-1,7-dioic acid hydratase in catechol pathway